MLPDETGTANYATAQIVLLSGAPRLTGTGDAFRLDFGTVGRGAAAESVALGVENAAVRGCPR